MQSECKGGICGHSASAFGNSVSMPIAALGLSGYCNGYRATVAVICNSIFLGDVVSMHSACCLTSYLSLLCAGLWPDSLSRLITA